ncbi:MAG: hypothetical protein R6U40_05035 [Desulfobacterales bacterium]
MKKKLDEAARTALKMQLGYNDTQIKMIEKNANQMEMFEKLGQFASKKFVATCIKAENCAFNKVGDRYVFTAFGSMIKEESCDTPCLWAMSGFLPFSYMVYDRIASGLDPNEMHLNHVTCPDAGCRYGGFGSSLFKISVE